MGYVLEIDPVMIDIAGYIVTWYGFAYSFGFAGMTLWFWKQRHVLGWTVTDVIDASIVLVLTVLLGGRLFEVFVYEWEWYRQYPEQIPMLWKGGMASHGLFAGALLGAAVVARRTGTPLLRFLDSATVAAAFIFGVGRIGNFIEGGVIGTPTDLPWGVKLTDVEGFRHPVSLYDGVKNLLLIPVLAAVLRRWPAGRGIATATFFLGYGGLRFLVDQFRDYESVLWGMGPGQWFNLVMAAGGVLLFVVCRRREVQENVVHVTRRPQAFSLALASRSGLLVLLILLPSCIPTSWTTEYLALKRHPAQHTSP